MPSTAIIAAVAYGAGEAAVAYGLGTLGAAVVGAAAAATAGTALNGGSWGEQFGMGLLGAGVAAGVGSLASSGSSLGSGIGEASAGASSIGSGIGETAGSSLGGATMAAPGLEGSLGSGLASSSLEGAITPSFSSLGDGLGSGAGSTAGTASGGLGSGLGMTVDSAGSSALGSGIGSPATSSLGNSLSTPSGVSTGESFGGGGTESFQNLNSGQFGTADVVNGSGGQLGNNQLGSGFYNSDPNASLGFNGTSMTGGFSDLGTTSIPNAGASVVSDGQAALQSVQNGLGNLWDAATSQNGLKTIAGLYDMYSRNQAAKMYKDQLNQMNSMYAPGSAEYNALQNKVDRQNAAAGRRSTSLTNATNFANLIQQNRNAVLTSPSYMNTTNAYAQNKYGQLGSLFNLAGGLYRG